MSQGKAKDKRKNELTTININILGRGIIEIIVNTPPPPHFEGNH